MFIIMLIAVTTGLVATAAYFSVIGIASIFAYNYVPAMILGIALEAGKISVAVYLYRFWGLIPSLFKSILVSFMAVLMFITSVGIFGYLSQGYQKTAEEYHVLALELGNLEQEFEGKKKRMVEINKQVEQLPDNNVMGRIRLSREFSFELEEIRDRIGVIEPRIQKLRVKRVEFESQIGPIAYVAKILGMHQDDVVLYAILLLVFVADPLAITLTIACNMALLRFLEHRRVRPSAKRSYGKRMVDKVDDIVGKLRELAIQTRPTAMRPASARRKEPVLRKWRKKPVQRKWRKTARKAA